MARTKVVVDPITRIEGHLRIEAQSENGMIAKAWASSTQFRGIEIVMRDAQCGNLRIQFCVRAVIWIPKFMGNIGIRKHHRILSE